MARQRIVTTQMPATHAYLNRVLAEGGKVVLVTGTVVPPSKDKSWEDPSVEYFIVVEEPDGFQP